MIRKLTRAVAVLLVLGILVSLGIGCVPKAPEAATAPPPQEPAGEEAPSLSGVLEKAQGIPSYSCEMEVTIPQEEPIIAKSWWKGDKAKLAGNFEGQDVVRLLDMGTQEVLVYIPDEEIAFRMDYSSVEETVGEPPQLQVEEMMEYQPQTLGTEVIDGKECLVASYSKDGEQIKIWIWLEHGLPIRTESTTAEGTIVIMVRNIQIGEVPDSTFELSDGVEIMEMPEM